MLHNHHQHALADVHYDTSTHDHYPAHHHEWAGNNHFDTVNDSGADDHDVAVGDDVAHPGYDVRWPNVQRRAGRPT